MPGQYEPTWESLAQYRVPVWFQDIKFGIFIHWGIYSVPAFDNEWYPRSMYLRDHICFEHHRKTWGEQGVFGYKDFIPMFRGEKWGPEAWVDLFERSGAKYIVPVAEHHDGFPMYDCAFTEWSAAKMGPCRDIIAELERATRAKGLHFGVSSHRAFNWRYYSFEEEFDTVKSENSGLYGPAHPQGLPASPAFLADWWARTTELIDKYHPEVLWFDFCWHEDEFEPFRRELTAYYYNRALEWGTEVVLNYKDKFPDGTAVFDIERGKLDGLREHYWQTDTSIGRRSWCYIEGEEFRTVSSLVHDLVDIVSKNGNLLLNIGPKPDGTIPEGYTQGLLGIGEWLRVNGEAIYGTRHWHSYGEGPTKVPVEVKFNEKEQQPYTERDIRFTKKGDALYAICLGWPAKEWKITSLGMKAGQVGAVSLLGSQEKLSWKQTADGLTVQAPRQKPCEHAYALKISLTH
jgi:alpha-L-fucosidase